MRKTFVYIMRALFSRAALAYLYERRRLMQPAIENRTPLALAVAGSLFVLIMSFLLSMAWFRTNVDNWLEGRQSTKVLPELVTSWMITEPRPADICIGPQTCRINMYSVQKKFEDLRHIHFQHDDDSSIEHVIGLQQNIQTFSWASFPLKKDQGIVIQLPKLRFNLAYTFVDGVFYGTQKFSEQISVSLRQDEFIDKESVVIETYLIFNGRQDVFGLLTNPRQNLVDQNVTIFSNSDFSAYKTFAAADQSSRGNFIGLVARIVMAVFVLVLFLVVDGSPESLGLGLFLGFEAFAISLSYRWIPFLEDSVILRHYCYQMGDIFRLYFFLQLARLIDKRVGAWLLWGTVLSVPYGLLRVYGAEFDWTWVNHIPNWRDAIVGSIGLLVCIRAAVFLRGKKLPWRVTALIVAAAGSFEQTVDPILSYFPLVHNIGFIQSTIDILEPLSAWLLAFSAFINISTLENRVRKLSEVKSRADEIEQEMQLGRTVQRALVSMPQMPPVCKIDWHQDAMLYVSGDTYYVDWDRSRKCVTFLVNDVTGHGVQAALKASAATVIAKTLFDRNDLPSNGVRLKNYDKLVEDYLISISDVPDISAMIGGEFYLETGDLFLYRVNFPFPIIIEPTVDLTDENPASFGSMWEVRLLALHNRKIVQEKLKPGAFVVFSSDGYFDNSRTTIEFIRHLKRKLVRKSQSLSTDDIKQIYLDCSLFKDTKGADDRTVLIFHWDILAERRSAESRGSESIHPAS